MFCPKCKAKIGVLRYDSRTLSHVAQGMTCCVCGYWMEGEIDNVNSAGSSRRSARR